MTPPSKKSPQASSSKPAKKSVSILGSMLNSTFSKDSSSTTAPKGSKHVDSKESKIRPEEPKCSSSKHTSKSIKSSKSKHPTEPTKCATSKSKSTVPSLKLSEAATVKSITLLDSAFFEDESRVSVDASRNSAPVQSTTPRIKTAFISEHDKKMATRQLKIDALSEIELQEQEEWAQVKLIESGTCPMGWGWQRYTAPEGYSQFNGYRCYGGASTHLVSHELLAEGRNRVYQLNQDTNWWEGPFDANVVRQELLDRREEQQEEPNVVEARPLTQDQFDEILRNILSPHQE